MSTSDLLPKSGPSKAGLQAGKNHEVRGDLAPCCPVLLLMMIMMLQISVLRQMISALSLFLPSLSSLPPLSYFLLVLSLMTSPQQSEVLLVGAAAVAAGGGTGASSACLSYSCGSAVVTGTTAAIIGNVYLPRKL